MKNKYNDNDIAIIGMSAFVPGATSLDAFWRNLAQGADAITDVPEDVIEPLYFGATDNSKPDRFYSNRGGFTSKAFVDPLRYGVLPVAAEGADPDQLFSLMMVEEALNDAGVLQKGQDLHDASIIIGKGNFAGLPQLRSSEIVRIAEELTGIIRHAFPDMDEETLQTIKKDYQSRFGRYQGDTATATMPNLVASGVANHFDMHGMAYTVDAACASGIVSLEHGIELLQSGKSNLAVVGAMHIAHSSVFWSAFNIMGAQSKKGEISPFSEDADGLLIGQGGGFMVIKRLKDAVRDKDRIYAVVKGTAVGSDGGGHSVLVTDAKGQERVIKAAWDKAGLDPADATYVEMHGTGTPVGDATEVVSLKSVFGEKQADQETAWMGSVKSNIGHLMPAAGMIGLIKTTLALYHRQIPATLHCEKPLKALQDSRLQPAQELIDWEASGQPLLAGVNAFGFGGINGHAVLAAYEPPKKEVKRYRAAKHRHHLPQAVVVTAATQEALIAKIDLEQFENLVGGFIGKASDQHRLVIFNPTVERMALAVDFIKRGQAIYGLQDIWYSNKALLKDGGKLAFMFPGWYTTTGLEVEHLADDLGLEVSEFPGEAKGLDQILWDHYQLGQVTHQALEKTGIKADLYTGHSIGEWHAARANGQLDDGFETANMNFSADESNHLKAEDVPDIVVLAVSVGKENPVLNKVLTDMPEVYLTNSNCPEQVVITLVRHDLAQVEAAFKAGKINYQILPFASGLHCPFMDPVIDVPMKSLASLTVQAGKKTLWSAINVSPITAVGEGADQVFGSQLTQPVYFRETIEAMYEQDQARVFVQLGGGSLANFVADTLKGREFAAISALSTTKSSVDQLRRVHALVFIMGGEADLDFLGMSRLSQDTKSIFLMPNNAPLQDNLESFNQAVSDYMGERQSQAKQPSITKQAQVPSSSSEAVPASLSAPTQAERLGQQQVAAVTTYPVNRRGLPARGFTRRGGHVALAQVESQVGQLSAVSQVEPELAQVQTSQVAVQVQEPVGARPRAGHKFEIPKTFDLKDYPYVMDHSIVNQPIGWQNQEDLYPVIPLTMSMELLAEIALEQAPDLKVLKLGKITAMNFIPLDKPFETVIKGHWKTDYVLNLTIPGYIQMDITMGDTYETADMDFVKQAEKDLGPDVMTPLSPQESYDTYSFHREKYRTLVESKRYAKNGFHTLVEKREGKGSLLDQMGQNIGLFLHLYAENKKVSFPVRVDRVEFYQDIFDQDGLFESFIVIRKVTDNYINADIIYLRDGKVWAIARNWLNQRLDMSKEAWAIVNYPQRSMLAEEIKTGIFYYKNEKPTRQLFSFLFLRYLTSFEKAHGLSKPQDEDKKNFLIGRVALKDAVRYHLANRKPEYLYPIEIGTSYTDLGQPQIISNSDQPLAKAVHASVAHKDSRGVAVASDQPVGIDIEKIEAKDEAFWRHVLTEQETALLEGYDLQDEWRIRFWCAKEAYGKFLGQGLQGNPKQYEVTKIEGDKLYINDLAIETLVMDDGYLVAHTPLT